jgi:hypothetical protein
MSDMTILIQVRARYDDAGQALIERLQASLPPAPTGPHGT